MNSEVLWYVQWRITTLEHGKKVAPKSDPAVCLALFYCREKKLLQHSDIGDAIINRYENIWKYAL